MFGWFKRRPVTIRLWTLGSLEHRMVPNQAAIERLANILKDWDGKSDLEIIWGPELRLTQYVADPNDRNVISLPKVSIKNGECVNSVAEC